MLSRLGSLEVGRGPWNALSINHRGLNEENTEEEVNRVTQELFKLLGMIGGPPISPGQDTKLVGGLEHEFYFSIYWECHHPT
jgi:hypothetical protein